MLRLRMEENEIIEGVAAGFALYRQQISVGF
jgi:phage shock protein PspC (stress-responsive transcriptional regulator)